MKKISLSAALSLCSIMALSAPAFADQSDKLMATAPGSFVGMTDMDAKYPVDPQTGKRLGVIDWNCTGRDISQHPHGARHDAKLCGICG